LKSGISFKAGEKLIHAPVIIAGRAATFF
jgi:hypothetical protein